jgi:hypothetical protein
MAHPTSPARTTSAFAKGKSAFGEPAAHGGPAKQAVPSRRLLCKSLPGNSMAWLNIDEDPVRAQCIGANNLAKKNA